MNSVNRLTVSDELRDWVESVVGAFTVEASENHTHNLSDVWRLQTEDGIVYLKAATIPAKCEQERHAYERWTGPTFGDFAPRLLAARTAPSAILVSALPGVAMERLELSPAQNRAVWFDAAQRLARLHGFAQNAWFGNVRRNGEPANQSYTDADAYMRERMGNWVERGVRGQILTSSETAFVKAVADDWLGALANLPAVPAHRDFTPRNWICDARTGKWTGAIDWEAACWSLWVSDISRPWTREFVRQPDLAEAFWDGYQGHAPTDKQQAQVKAVRLFHCVSSIVWAAEYNEQPFVYESRAGLEALRKL